MFFSIAKLGGLNIRIRFRYLENYKRYNDFITHDTPQIDIDISLERLSEEKNIMYSAYPERHFSDIDIEFNALYQDIPPILFQNGVITFHGVLVEMNNEGYLFSADSGIGKSTHARFWTEAFPEKARIINGDKPLLRLCDDGLYGFGSPWMGKENIGINKSVKIKAICFLSRNNYNVIHPLQKCSDTIERLIRQSMIKNREQILLNLYHWYNNILNCVEFYHMGCTNSIDAAIVAFKGMNSNNDA